MIAESPAMRPGPRVIERVGPSDANVLITGENGTGKGVVARALHAASRRAAQALRDAQRRGHLGRRLRERALRPRAGRLHRRARGPRRPLRARRRRHALPRRDRQRPGEPAGQAPARPRDRGVRAGRLLADAALRRPRSLSATNADLRGRGRRRTIPPGPPLPAQHDRDPRAAAARAARRHSPARPALPREPRRGATARSSPASSRPPWRPCSRTAGRATCGSSTTPSNGPCS